MQRVRLRLDKLATIPVLDPERTLQLIDRVIGSHLMGPGLTSNSR